MEKVNVIHANEFADYLRQNGLVIGKASEFVGNLEFDLQVKRANLKKKKAATFKEILETKIMLIDSKNALSYWISQGKFKEGETYKCAKSNRKMILTAALVRMDYL